MNGEAEGGGAEDGRTGREPVARTDFADVQHPRLQHLLPAERQQLPRESGRAAHRLGDLAQGRPVFIFPEGKMSAFKNLDLKRKFYPGIGRMIQSAARKKKRVKVVTLGFAFDKNKAGEQPLGSVYVGQPIYFRQGEDGNLLLQSGSFAFSDLGRHQRGLGARPERVGPDGDSPVLPEIVGDGWGVAADGEVGTRAEGDV